MAPIQIREANDATIRSAVDAAVSETRSVLASVLSGETPEVRKAKLNLQWCNYLKTGEEQRDVNLGGNGGSLVSQNSIKDLLTPRSS